MEQIFFHQQTQAEFRETVHIFKIITEISLNTETYFLNAAVMMMIMIITLVIIMKNLNCIIDSWRKNSSKCFNTRR